jgi:hypothetical protein
MRGQNRSSEVSAVSPGGRSASWGELIVMLLGAMASAVVTAIAVSLLYFRDVEVIGAAMLVPAITVTPCILLFLVLDRLWTRAAAWIALTNSLMIPVVCFVVVALNANEKPEIAWYIAGTTFASGVAACVTLMRITCSQNRGHEQTGI